MSSSPVQQNAAADAERQASALYGSPSDGLKSVQNDFLYWTGKLTDSSFELSIALVAANWAAFGSVDKILNNTLAKMSLAVVMLCLLLALLGAKWMSELHRKRVIYASSDTKRWQQECSESLGRPRDPWPFTTKIERLGRTLREIKVWLPAFGWLLFLIALLRA
jgi:hypothetical protein